MIERVIFLILFGILIGIILNLSFKNKIKNDFWIKLLLILIGFLIAAYVRLIVYKNLIFASSDESNYISILYQIATNKYTVISGPGFTYLIQLINHLTKIEYLSLLSYFGIIMTSITLIIIYVLYKHELKDIKYSLLSTIVLLLTTYFLWPAIESRPQQIGMLLVLISVYLYYKYLTERKYLILFISACTITFVYHILSFIILGGIIIIHSYMGILKKNNKENLRKFIYNLIIFSLFFIYFAFTKGIYLNMKNGLLILLKNYPLCLLRFPIIAIEVIFFMSLILVLVILVLKKVNLEEKIDNLLKNKNIIISVFILVFIGIVIQYNLESNIHSSLYLNSKQYLLFFELGNLFYGLLFLIGVWKMKNENKKSIFLDCSLILMLMGGIMIIFSLFFPGGFTNGMIRMINYWTIFAAPIVAYSLKSIKPSKLLTLIITILIITSLISASKDPQLFNNDYFWSKEDITAVKYACTNNGTFVIDYNKTQQITLSKQRTYPRLLRILINKDQLNCTGNLAKYQFEEILNLSYDLGEIKVYEIIGFNTENQSNISVNINQYQIKPEIEIAPNINFNINNDPRCIK